MSAQPWGKTGMVTIRRCVDTDEVGHVDHDVNVDGLYVGQVCHWPTQYDGFAAEAGGSESPYIPTLDAAVMWVLRRADAKLWREERGPVWQVARCGGPEFIGGPGWDAWLPSTGKFGHHKTHADAIKAATS